MSELVLGAVAYDPKVVTTWDSFRAWLREQGLPFDYVLYSNYERQVEELVAGRIHLAWNSPLAWVRALRLAQAGGITLRPVLMRDTDCGLSSVIVVRQDSPAQSVKDLRGLVVATGAVDSPQATLLPLSLLRDAGLEPGIDVRFRRYALVSAGTVTTSRGTLRGPGRHEAGWGSRMTNRKRSGIDPETASRTPRLFPCIPCVPCSKLFVSYSSSLTLRLLLSVSSRSIQSPSPSYRTAIGLPGEPVAPLSRNGAKMKANS